MKVIGTVIARLNSERLAYKNLLPFDGVPLVGLGIRKLRKSRLVDEIVVSTESELIARIALEFGAKVLRRPPTLAEADVPSIPVFQHIVENFRCDLHVNYNINFPLCRLEVIDRAVQIALEKGEALSEPFAVWAQTSSCLCAYGDPWKITAFRFQDDRAGEIDVHTEEDLLRAYRMAGATPAGWF